MRKIIIADTSCLIVLTNIGELQILHKMYGEVLTTLDIAIEYGDSLPDWIEIVKVKDKYKQQILELQIDKGESSAIALALETQGSTVILDDFKARKIANQLGISLTGTLGIIIKAKQIGIIERNYQVFGTQPLTG
jgi:predicted nucleic acid-binding protein